VDLVREIQDPTAGAKLLVDHALAHFSTDNLSCMIVRFDKGAILANKEHGIGVEGDQSGVAGKVSEADKIVRSTRQKIADGDVPPIGVSASNSGRGHDPSSSVDESEAAFVPTTIEGSVEEEPSSASEESPETTPEGSVSTAESEAPEQSSKTAP
jgi:protein phosphatase PTC1